MTFGGGSWEKWELFKLFIHTNGDTKSEKVENMQDSFVSTSGPDAGVFIYRI